jgi:hypothetical protein
MRQLLTSTLLALTLSVVFSGSLYALTQEEEDQAAREDAMNFFQAIKATGERQKAERAKDDLDFSVSRPSIDLAMKRALPEKYVVPSSAWQSREKAQYSGALEHGRYDVLLAPFQVQKYALDQPTRSILSAELSRGLGKMSVQLPDPYVVARALGDGSRTISADEVYHLAALLGSKRIIWAYIGHDGKTPNHLTVTFRIQESGDRIRIGAQTPSATINFETIPIAEDESPIDAFRAVLPQILSALVPGHTLPAATKQESRIGQDGHLELPDPMSKRRPNPASEALLFQVLASLTPTYADRTRERFAEKSLLAVENMAPSSPEYRLLKARGLMLLHQRPAALRALGEPSNAAERELAAVLNGNLAKAINEAPKIPQPQLRLLTALDINKIQSNYELIDVAASRTASHGLGIKGPMWSMLVERAFADWSSWAQFNNMPVKLLLDERFPVPGYAAENLIRGVGSIGGRDDVALSLDLSIVEHAQRFRQANISRWCCNQSISEVTDADVLDLLEAIGTDNVIRRARLMAVQQGLYDSALDYLRQIDAPYRDHPQVVALRAFAQAKLARSKERPMRDNLLQTAGTDAFTALYWEQGQTTNAVDVQRLRQSRSNDPYLKDIPFRPGYLSIPEEQAAWAALANSTSEVGPVGWLQWMFSQKPIQQEKLDALLASLNGRFEGNPDLAVRRALNDIVQGNDLAAERRFRENIRLQPSHWENYGRLGMMLFNRGEVEEAGHLILSYPGFEPGSGIDAVELSNYAFEAGSRFYWAGYLEPATRLYTIAANLQTGSNSSITSGIRLKLLRGDYVGAMEDSRYRATRYNSPHAYRDYLGLLHVMGRSNEAWDALNLVLERSNTSYPMETALVGHRLAGASDAQVAAWAKNAMLIGQRHSHFTHGPPYLVRAGLMDRMPNDQFPALVADVATPSWREHNPDGDPIKDTISIEVVFSGAYRAIRTGQYKQAQQVLQSWLQTNDRPNQQGQRLSLLPYVAFAAAKAGDAHKTAELLAEFSGANHSFDHYLAQGIQLAMEGRHDEAKLRLKDALHQRPFTENRLMDIEYEYGEILEWLAQATGHKEYSAMALTWARTCNKTQPWYSWSHAMVATLSTDPNERRREIAMTLFLDPKSERLGRISDSERAAATRTAGKKNPFLVERVGIRGDI